MITLILDKVLLRLAIHILSIKYLKNKALYFIIVIEYNNPGFNRKIIEDKNSKENGKKAVTNSKKKKQKKSIM